MCRVCIEIDSFYIQILSHIQVVCEHAKHAYAFSLLNSQNSIWSASSCQLSRASPAYASFLKPPIVGIYYNRDNLLPVHHTGKFQNQSPGLNTSIFFQMSSSMLFSRRLLAYCHITIVQLQVTTAFLLISIAFATCSCAAWTSTLITQKHHIPRNNITGGHSQNPRSTRKTTYVC